MSHTTTPWRVTEPGEKKGREIVGANGELVARLTALDMGNAALIVAAVNEYIARRTPKVPECCGCGTKEGLHKDGWYGYRCNSEDCMVL